MPPPLPESENESSDTEAAKTVAVESSAKKRGRPKKTPSVSEEEKEVLAVEEDENQDEEEEEEENEEDVYIVETIKTHMFDNKGNILFHVKWEGYDKPSDMTWEPEENLGTAGEIVEEYYNSIGGRQFVHDEARAATKQPKKRGRASTGATPAPKKGKKEQHPRNATPPASLKEKAFKPPSGSWEEEVKAVDACEGTDGEVQVYLTWNNGHKTCHPKEMVYKRCPQRMLKFYESHLSFSPKPKKSKDKTNKTTESSRKEAAPARRKSTDK